MTKIRFDNIEKVYNEKLMKKDITDVKKDMSAISSATDIKKARISAVATSIAALLAAIAAIIVAFLK